ncbi:MAG: DEAD/DEAH box helicase [Alphaproteobacteria bacterium]|nr:DEAD/DEAH box helicase [Alphaproteobacteria bacterium]
MNFADLGLKPEILQAIAEVGYTTPTPIQEQAIPVVLKGRDVMGIAQTGTGKTAGFTLPMIERLAVGRARARMPRSLILEPTRELATQVAENFELYGKHERLTHALLIGGSSFEDQIRKLDRGVDILIATPGRMLDLFERGKVLLADVGILVIDEADRMLDMGFIPDIERIVGLLPRARQTLMFSATMPPEISKLANRFLADPIEVKVARPATTAENVSQHLAVVAADDKREALRQLLNQEDVRNALIFCNRKRDVSIVYRSLAKHGFNAAQLHGDLPQSTRTETLESFKRGDTKILVCSDVAARGLDISELSHVFNFDVPTNPDDYVHRIGRTARAGRSGRAFTLATPDEGKYVAGIARLIDRTLDQVELGGIEPVSLSDDDGRRRRRKAKPAKREAQKGEAEAARPRARRSDSKDQPAPQQRGRGGEDDRPGTPQPTADRTRTPAPPRQGRPSREEDSAPVGLGDHVPAFLLRPIRRPEPPVKDRTSHDS